MCSGIFPPLRTEDLGQFAPQKPFFGEWMLDDGYIYRPWRWEGPRDIPAVRLSLASLGEINGHAVRLQKSPKRAQLRRSAGECTGVSHWSASPQSPR